MGTRKENVMGASTSVYGIRKPDKKWLEYKKIIDSLEDAGLTWEDAPDEVKDFFGWDRPDPDGISIRLGGQYGDDLHEAVSLHDANDYEDGYVIEIAKLPENITHIKVVTSY
jgi:hypothetical protein